jgi:hypothetical protein
MIEIKILSCRSAQRYAIKQRVVAAKRDLQNDYLELEIAIIELKEWINIEPYTLMLSAPSLVVNEILVCEGRFPTRQEVLDWVRDALINNRS